MPAGTKLLAASGRPNVVYFPTEIDKMLDCLGSILSWIKRVSRNEEDTSQEDPGTDLTCRGSHPVLHGRELADMDRDSGRDSVIRSKGI